MYPVSILPSYIQQLAVRLLVFGKTPAGFYIRLWSLALADDPSVVVLYAQFGANIRGPTQRTGVLGAPL